MKDIFFNVTFWLGAAVLTLLLLWGVLWIGDKVLNKMGKHLKIVWNIFEYAFYKNSFDEWLIDTGRERNPRSERKKLWLANILFGAMLVVNLLMFGVLYLSFMYVVKQFEIW